MQVCRTGKLILFPLLSTQAVTGFPVIVLLSAASNHKESWRGGPSRIGNHQKWWFQYLRPSSLKATKPLVLGPLVKSVVKILETVPRPLVNGHRQVSCLTSAGTFWAVTVKVYCRNGGKVRNSTPVTSISGSCKIRPLEASRF